MNRPRILVLALALALSSASVLSTGLESRGPAPQSISPLGTYGMGVATRMGLKAIVPTNWKVYVHQSVTLPETMDWSVGDTWMQALERLTRNNDLALLVDWENKTLMLRTRDVAVQEAATRQEIGQAAVTPLPKFKSEAKTAAVTGALMAIDEKAPPEESQRLPAAKFLIDTRPVVIAEAKATEQPAKLSADVYAIKTTPLVSVGAKNTSKAREASTASGSDTAVSNSAQASPSVPAVDMVVVANAVAAMAQENETRLKKSTVQANAPTPVEAVAMATKPAMAQAPEQKPQALLVAAQGASSTVGLAAPVVVAAASATASVAPPSSIVVERPAIPVIRSNPTPEMVATQAAAVASRGARLTSTEEFSYSQAVALNKPTVKKVIQGIANKYNLRLVWAAASEYTLRGPVTLLAQDAAQDIELLQKSVGRNTPFVMEMSPSEGVIRVFNVGGPRPLGIASGITEGYLPAGIPSDLSSRASARVDTRNAGAAPPAVAPVPSEPPQPATAAVVAVKSGLHLEINANQPLEDALSEFTHEQGYTLEWKIEGGFEANRAMAYDGDTVTQVLAKVLPALGLSADVYTRDKHIIIRPGDTRN